MMKHIYIVLLSIGATIALAQNDNSFGNLPLTNIANTSNAAASQAQSNFTGNRQADLQQMLPENNIGLQAGNKISDGNIQQQALNNNDNNVDAPIQQASANQGKSNNNEGASFALTRPSMSLGGGSSRSSGKNNSQHFSKKMKKLNRRMSYVFSKKQKRSYTVDFCFAWSK